jgi:hypothetical protein
VGRAISGRRICEGLEGSVHVDRYPETDETGLILKL